MTHTINFIPIFLIKGYSRLGAALSFLDNPMEARKAYEKGLELDPNNAQLQNDLKALKSKFSGICTVQGKFLLLLVSRPVVSNAFADPKHTFKLPFIQGK